MVTVHPERPGDAAAIHAVHAASFPTDLEARLVDLLRAAGRLRWSRRSMAWSSGTSPSAR
jgi:predicted N-acetyltransferase YhbS